MSEDAAQPEPDSGYQVAEPESVQTVSEVGINEREAELEAELEGLRSQLASRDAEIAKLSEQTGESLSTLFEGFVHCGGCDAKATTDGR